MPFNYNNQTHLLYIYIGWVWSGLFIWRVYCDIQIIKIENDRVQARPPISPEDIGGLGSSYACISIFNASYIPNIYQILKQNPVTFPLRIPIYTPTMFTIIIANTYITFPSQISPPLSKPKHYNIPVTNPNTTVTHKTIIIIVYIVTLLYNVRYWLIKPNYNFSSCARIHLFHTIF